MPHGELLQDSDASKAGSFDRHGFHAAPSRRRFREAALRVAVSGVIACKTNSLFDGIVAAYSGILKNLILTICSKPLPRVPSFVVFYLFSFGRGDRSEFRDPGPP